MVYVIALVPMLCGIYGVLFYGLVFIQSFKPYILVYMLINVLLIVISVGLFQKKEWARGGLVFLWIISALAVILGTFLWGFSVFNLLKVGLFISFIIFLSLPKVKKIYN